MRHARVLRGASVAVLVLLIPAAATAQAQVSGPGVGIVGHASAAPARQPPLTPGLALALSRDVTDKVVIVLRNQLPGLPDTPRDSARRTAAVASTQRAVLRELTATHARDVKPITLINAVAATVSPGEAKRLAGNPAVAEVTPDLPIPVASSAPPASLARPDKGFTPLPGACPVKRTGVQLDPEAVENVHAATQSGKNSSRALGYTGAGVKVAFIADGLDPDNPDFIRADGRHVFVDYRDFSGTGTDAPTGGGEAFLDASSIAAQGRHVYNIQKLAGLSRPCLMRILGVAPGASLVGLNVVGGSFTVFLSVFIEAINFAVTVDHVNVINESFGIHPFPDAGSLDLTEQADNAAVKAGVTVTVASGDSGVTNTIASPASDPNVISAGATTTYRSYAQTGLFLAAPRLEKGWIDNNISGLSSAGFDEAGRTVDVVAPGDLNWALCSANGKKFFDCGGFPVELQGGTSEAAPLTAGVAALVIQAYRRSHHGRSPSPATVRRIIVSTAQNIGAPADQQGAGMIDAYQAVLAARSYTGTTTTRKGHAILESATQLNAIAPRSTAEHFTETLTNDGAGKETVHLSSRTLSPYTTILAKTLHLNSASFNGEVKFRVARGQARLNVSVALRGFVNISLISPKGDLAEYNLPQGEGNYGNAQVANPAPGTWTAFVSDGGSPDASFLAQTATWRPFGTLSAKSITLGSGASRSFSLTVPTPAQPGDQAGSIVLRSSASRPAFAAVTTIPVTLRSLAPVPSAFSGTLTGGNGRDSNDGQTAYYEMDVNSALPALNATITTGNRNNTMFAELVSPSGVAESAANNGLLKTNIHGNQVLVHDLGTQLHVLNPARGRWTLVVDFYNTVSGTAATQPFDVSVNGSAPRSTESGLPTSASTKLEAGKAITASLTVTNHSTLPTEYFVDARLRRQVSVRLAPQQPADFFLPDESGAVPTYLVPPFTTRLSATVTAPKPNFFEFSWPFGDPGVLSSTGKISKATLLAPDIPAGDWTVQPYLHGPDGKKGVRQVQAHASATAVMAAIDPAVSSPTGDLWSGVTNRNATLTPYFVQPGQTITIPVRITPRGAVGSVVSGRVYVSDVSFNPGLLDSIGLFGIFPTASNVASFAYRYTITR